MANFSPTSQLRAAVKAVIVAEFAAEGFPVKDDKLHASVGESGPIAATYPESELSPSGTLEIQPIIVVQVYGRWQAPGTELNKITVDPGLIEEWAWRLRRALRTHLSPATEQLGFANVVGVDYPDDPTGNKTRFEMRIQGFGPNSAVVETSA